jgi:hypothetical protein
MTDDVRIRFKSWLWRPPRPRGDIIADRRMRGHQPSRTTTTSPGAFTVLLLISIIRIQERRWFRGIDAATRLTKV